MKAKLMLHPGPFLCFPQPRASKKGCSGPPAAISLGTDRQELGVPGSPDPNTIRHHQRSAFICKAVAEAEVEGGS